MSLSDTLKDSVNRYLRNLKKMRHGKKNNHLGRKTAHRKAMLSNMACSLLLHKRINTTVAKAKALRVYVEPLITKSKTDTTHSRRAVFSELQSKEIVTELFRDISLKVATRNGGYTRIIRTGYRLGDNAEMCLIELVDYNDLYSNESSKKVTRRSRRGGAKKADDVAEDSTSTEEVVVDETPEAPSTDVANDVQDEAESTDEAETKED